jgi:3-deoxy-D-manno-octulosonate 8-phosphate phosphatase (KDO 8-P phosphatase)
MHLTLQLYLRLFHPRLYFSFSILKLLVLDVDGVLTDGVLFYTNQATIIRRFHVHDGLGIKLLQQINVKILVISGGHGDSIDDRLISLGITHFGTSVKNKLEYLRRFQIEHRINPEETVYIGDDINDLTVLPVVAHFLAPIDAHPLVRTNSSYILSKRGGFGAVREATDLILLARKSYFCFSRGWIGTN